LLVLSSIYIYIYKLMYVIYFRQQLLHQVVYLLSCKVQGQLALGLLAALVFSGQQVVQRLPSPICLKR